MIRLFRQIGQTARLMVGVPDYARYVEAHRRSGRCGQPMSQGDFCRERARRRFGADGKGGVRCC